MRPLRSNHPFQWNHSLPRPNNNLDNSAYYVALYKNLLPPKRTIFNDIETYSNIELYNFDHQTFVLLLNVITEK